MQPVEIAVSNAKFHLLQEETNQSIVANVFRSINQTEEVPVAADLAAEEVPVAADLAAAEEVLVAAAEEVMTEDHEKCIKQLVEIVARIVKYHSSQDRINQSTAMNVFQIINQQETKKKILL
jgi:acetate kinase